MLLKCIQLVTLAALVSADEKWTWKDNNRDPEAVRRDFDTDGSRRYEVVEDLPGESNNYIPIRPGGAPIYGNRPHRPPIAPDHRPGGVYGGGYRPLPGDGYGQGGYEDEEDQPEILTGPVPSWVKERPFKNFDKCKCTERFNCQSPGISYGHCDVGKQYCCSVRKEDALGGPLPSRPVHSPENGILAGPGGPVDGIRPFRPGYGDANRRPYDRPGYSRPPGGYLHGRPNAYGIGGRPHRPIQSPENGVLVGPGGPFDYHSGAANNGYGLKRSANKAEDAP